MIINLHEAYNNAPSVRVAQDIYGMMLTIWTAIQEHRRASIEELADICDMSPVTIQNYLTTAEFLECEECGAWFHEELDSMADCAVCAKENY